MTARGDLADLQQAIESYQQACERGLDVAAKASLRSAPNWKNWAFQRQAWEEAEQASNYARHAIKQLLKIQLVRQSQESWLREIQGLAADAAYAIAVHSTQPAASLQHIQGL